MKTSDSINELATALAAVQGAMEPARMNAVNPFLKNKYADLNSVIESVKLLLAENGLSYVQMPNTPPIEYGPAIGLTTRLMHSSGQWIEETYTMPMPSEERGKSMMQVAGSAISYARRYALSAMLGIVADEDSDGNGQQDRGRNVSKQSAPPAKQNGNGRQPTPHATNRIESELDTMVNELDAALGTTPPNNGKKHTVSTDQQKPSEAQMRQFHSLGEQAYGPDWPDKRHELVSYVTDGRSESSKHLTVSEWQRLMDGMSKRLQTEPA